MKVISATSARANLFGLIDQVTEEGEEVMITTKRKNAILVSEEDWRSLQNKLLGKNGRKGPRPFGLAKGAFVVPDDFNDPLPNEVLDDFED
jgi:prevent-host-death family protein